MKLWAGRLKGDVDSRLNEINASIGFDSKMVIQDITGSIAHAKMLGRTNIIDLKESEKIVIELEHILSEIQEGILQIDYSAEDVHTFIEQELTKRLDTLGKKLHTARSRNDQVCLDLRMYLSDEVAHTINLIKDLVGTLCELSKNNLETVMPGYTHLQRAQPVSLAHHFMAYAQMFSRDIDRLKDCKKRILMMPLGSGALASTTYPLDRDFVAEELGFIDITKNSMDSVSDRDFVIELLSDLSIIMMHLSRFSEEIIMWCSWEFKFMSLSDKFSTGSSIMPQKKNPDTPELIRGKTGRVYGDLMSILTIMKALPLAYNKDMQEDKESIFDGIETVQKCLEVFTPMIESAVINKENMLKATKDGFVNATDCADYMVKKGIAFRDAYIIVGDLVNECILKGISLDELSLADYKKYSEKFEEDIYDAIDVLNCVNRRNVKGGPAPQRVLEQIKQCLENLEN